MGKLSLGDARFIDDAVTAFRMYTDRVLSFFPEIPKETGERIEKLTEAYGKALTAYFEEHSAPDADADELLAGFEKGWVQEHPEFADAGKLFAGCDGEKLKEALERLSAADSVNADDPG